MNHHDEISPNSRRTSGGRVLTSRGFIRFDIRREQVEELRKIKIEKTHVEVAHEAVTTVLDADVEANESPRSEDATS